MASDSRGYVPGWIVGLFVAAMVVSVFASAYFGFEVGRSNPKLIYQTVTSRDFTVVTVPSLVLQTQTVTAPAIVVTTTTTVTTGQYWTQGYGLCNLVVMVYNSSVSSLTFIVTNVRTGQQWFREGWVGYLPPHFPIQAAFDLPQFQVYEIVVQPLGYRRIVYLTQYWNQEVFP